MHLVLFSWRPYPKTRVHPRNTSLQHAVSVVHHESSSWPSWEEWREFWRGPWGFIVRQTKVRTECFLSNHVWPPTLFCRDDECFTFRFGWSTILSDSRCWRCYRLEPYKCTVADHTRGRSGGWSAHVHISPTDSINCTLEINPCSSIYRKIYKKIVRTWEGIEVSNHKYN